MLNGEIGNPTFPRRTLRGALAATPADEFIYRKKDSVARKAGSLRLFPGLVEASDRRHSPGTLLLSL